METQVFRLLENTELNNLEILNGDIFTCKSSDKSAPCLQCLSCRLKLIKKFTISLMSHMTNNEILQFIEQCLKSDSETDVFSILEILLFPLNGKDRVYSLSRARPSLNTDVMDFGLKNFTVSRVHLYDLICKISEWIQQQPILFRKQFLISVFSNMKVAVLSQLYRMLKNSDDSTIRVDFRANEIVDNSNLETAVANSDVKPTESKLDLISALPVHISKYILNFLDEKSLQNSSLVCENWKKIIGEIRKEDVVNQQIKEQAALMQAKKASKTSTVLTVSVDPSYARDVTIKIPKIDPGDKKVILQNGCESVPKSDLLADNNDEDASDLMSRKCFNMETAFKNIATKNMIMEERNVYCGSYSVLLIKEGISKEKGGSRTISFNGGDLVAVGGSDRKVEFLDVDCKLNSAFKTRIHGHSGTITVVRIIGKRGHSVSNIKSGDVEVLTGSYDTTIRRWNVDTGKCLKIYIGHASTVTALDVDENVFVSTSLDGTCKVWKYDERECLFSMRHRHATLSVSLTSQFCVSGDSTGLVKIWDIHDGKFIKRLKGHRKEITGIRSDNVHIVSSSLDCCALLWSAVGDFDSCIGRFRHPKPVLSMEFMFLRVITGCEDGRIRIWNALNGQCLRLFRGNSKSDPILNMVAYGDRILINTVSNILVLNFEPITWVYWSNDTPRLTLSARSEEITSFIPKAKDIPERKHQDLHIRVCQRNVRARFAGNIDPRIFLAPKHAEKKNVDSSLQKDNLSVREFDNSVELTRSTAWLISPPFIKSRAFKKYNRLAEETQLHTMEAAVEEPVDKSKTSDRRAVTSNYDRRISYGFENPNVVDFLGNMDNVKEIFRQHIRSTPQVAAAAMPQFVKTLVSQVKLSANTGKPIPTESTNDYKRPLSGPCRFDSKTKLAIRDIKKSLIPEAPPSESSESIDDIFQQNKKSVNNIQQKENQTLQLTSSAPSVSIPSFLQPALTINNVPKNYREKLRQIKMDLENKRLTDNEKLKPFHDKNSRDKFHSSVSNFNLQTYEKSKSYLQEIEEINQKYEHSRQLKQESQKYEKWLNKATISPDIKFCKDYVMKRPRSTKI